MDNEIIKNIESLALDMINNAGSGHSGIVMSSAPILYTLYSKHLNVSLNDPTWINRDRLVLSAGHASSLLYSILHMAGFNISIEDLKNYRKIGSKTPGHPEYGKTPCIEVTTGPLGQGFGTAVGMALGSKILSSKYIIPKKNLVTLDSHVIDYKVYVLASDGDLMEGISYEAASFAGTNKLNNLIVLYDSNNVSLDGTTDKSFKENVLDRFKALGWNTIEVRKGNSVSAIDKAIGSAKTSSKPTIIEFKTILGEGLDGAGTNIVHGKVLTDNELSRFKALNNMPNEKFYVSEDLKKQFSNMISSHTSPKYTAWAKIYEEYVTTYLSGDYSKLNYLFNKVGNYNILGQTYKFDPSTKEATRTTNGVILNSVARLVPNMLGGSADLSSSVKTYIDNAGDLSSDNYTGRNIFYGVREHAMGAITNGLALSKFIPFASTFLTFSDYMKPAIRMAALMKIPSLFIFSHDSVNIGSDGPTHQPIEQLASLRAIPNLNVYRPCDGNELVGCYQNIINSRQTPSVLILSKKEVELLPSTRADLVSRGAYIVFQPVPEFHLIFVATGSEVQTAVYIANELWRERKISVRVVSMPCMELYLNGPKDFQNNCLPKNIKTFTIEAGSRMGWDRFASDEDCVISIDDFGTSASANDSLKYSNFSYEQIKEKIIKNI